MVNRFLKIAALSALLIPGISWCDGEEPPDVYVRVGLVREELELIRHEMGKPRNDQPDIGVTNAAPREVFFQAMTLFSKADRMCFEQTRDRAPVPETPATVPQPPDVFRVADAALERIKRVKQYLNIPDATKELSRDANKTPNDVFISIVQANRQLNLLLDQQFSPSDVFQQVTRAIGYTSRLLAQFPGSTRIHEPPLFERGKRPADVYHRLVGCYKKVRQIAELSGHECLDLAIESDRIEEDTTPSDVYDIASLLVSELAYLHTQVATTTPPPGVYYPGRKFPSHVYQRAGILESQLLELAKWVSQYPEWLNEGARNE